MLLYSTHVFFFFNDTATTEIYTLSLHDALPICTSRSSRPETATERSARSSTSAATAVTSSPTRPAVARRSSARTTHGPTADRKSTRLNSSHANISYAVFCLKKKKKHHTTPYDST